MRSLIVAGVLCAANLAHATPYEVSTANELYSRLGMLQPGDEVIVHGGTYMTPGYVNYTWNGTAAQPINIHAADGEHPIIVGTFAQNTLNISGTYFTFKGFEVTGGSHGLRLGSVSNATFEDLVIHDIGDVGISCNFAPNNCDALTIRHNEIYNTGKDGTTGEGMYLGCNDGSCSLTNSIVENNYVHDMDGTQGDGIEVKTSSYGNIIRDNVIVRSKYPGITMYGYSGSGPANIVERNLVWHTTVDSGIQIVGQVIVRNNLVIDSAVYGIFSKPSNSINPHDATVVNNTVVGAGTACVRTTSWSGAANMTLANNAFYCEGGVAMDINGGASGATVTNNIVLGSGGVGSTTGISVAGDLGSDYYPPATSPLVNAGAAAQAPADDFNGTARDNMPDVGAYERSTPTNPGWTITEGFKDVSASLEPDAPPLTGGDDFPPTGTDPSDDGGCCSSTTRPASSWLALFVLGLLIRRRRR